MKQIDIIDAIDKAERFIACAKAAVDRIDRDGSIILMTGCKETAAAKRTSMDLTRALAYMRKP